MRKIYTLTLLASIFIYPGLIRPVSAQIHSHAMWTWMGSSNSAVTVYGQKGVPAAENHPGPRAYTVSWIDSLDNIYVFGGVKMASNGSQEGFYADLWKFDQQTGYWVFLSGEQGLFITGGTIHQPVYGTRNVADTVNKPGARLDAGGWMDNEGNLWLFGGWGFDKNSAVGILNDLWKFNPADSTWTWVKGGDLVSERGVYGSRRNSGANYRPGARQKFSSFSDKDGNFWLFGGNGFYASGNASSLNDLWKFDPRQQEWTWMSGDTLSTTKSVTYGTYQTLSAESHPPKRQNAVGVADAAGNIWIYSGRGEGATSNMTSDMWKYDAAADQWGWMAGNSSSTVTSVLHGTRGVFDPAHIPGRKRDEVFGGIDASRRYMIIYGGYGLAYQTATTQGNISTNVMWAFDTETYQFAWMGGDTIGTTQERLNKKMIPSPDNTPGIRGFARLLLGRNGNLWMYGGRVGHNSSVYGTIWMLDGCTIAPEKPLEFISSRDTLCEGAPEELYAVAKKENVYLYEWTLPSGWSGSSSSEAIAVQAASNSGALSVAAVNSCGSSSQLSVNVHVPALPSAPGVISGSAVVCPGEEVIYEISPVAGAESYSWQLPQGWTGSGTGPAIHAVAGTGNMGDVSVRANNKCGSSTQQVLGVSVLQPTAQPDLVQGAETVCAGTDAGYRIPPVAGALSYIWEIPADWQSPGSNMSDSIQVRAGSTPGTYTVAVRAVGVCDTSAARVTDVHIPVPPQAAVTYQNPTLTANAGFGLTYQWYYEGQEIGAATGVVHRPEKNGHYTVRVTDEHGCSDTAGAHVDDLKDDNDGGVPGSVSIRGADDSGYRLYPNPAGSRVYIRAAGGPVAEIHISAYNGKLISKHTQAEWLDISQLPSGVYFVTFYDAQGIRTGLERLVRL